VSLPDWTDTAKPAHKIAGMADTGDPSKAAPSAADRQAVAAKAAAAMWADDAASQALGMTLEEVRPGSARMTMRVRDDMVNGHSICHGGFVFALADSAFAFACNSYNRVTVAQGCDIVFVAPARLGDLLTAVAVERVRYGRNGICDVTVHAGERLIAEFRGRSRELGTLIVPEAPEAE
jgi:phenylacetic acid degradation protein PaaD